MLSLTEGHKAVLAAMSDYRVEFEESFRFQELIASLRLPEVTDDGTTTNDFGYSNEEEGVWEARTASMALVNALTNCPDALEERILLREEFGRRGLNEVIVVRLSFAGQCSHRLMLSPDAALHQAAGFLSHSTRRVYRGEVRR